MVITHPAIRIGICLDCRLMMVYNRSLWRGLVVMLSICTCSINGVVKKQLYKKAIMQYNHDGKSV